MKNIIFERRYREMPLNRGSVPQQRLALERLPEFAAELVRLNVDVIVATGTLGGDPRRIASVHSGTVVGFVGSETWITRYLSGCVLLGLREIA
jgi:hypothetical protein